MVLNYRKAINYLSIIPIILILYTVLIVDKSIPQGQVVGQSFWFCKIMPILVGFSALTFLTNRKSLSLSYIDLLFSLIIISGIIVTYTAFYEFTPHIRTLVLILTLYWSVKVLLSQNLNITYHILLLLLIVTGAIEAIWGIAQLYNLTYSQHSLFKTTGSFYNPGPYAGYLSIIAPVALHYCIKFWQNNHSKSTYKTWMRYILFPISTITLFGILIILPSTNSRASWLAIIAGCFTVFVLNRFNITELIKKNIKKLPIYISAIVIIFIILIYALYGLKKNSADGRLLIWKNTISQITDNPTGVGVGYYAGSYGKYQAAYFMEGKGSPQEELVAGTPEYAFNEYLQICAEFGIIPFILFLALIVMVIISGIKNKRYAPLGGFISLLVFAAMSYPFSLTPFLILFVLLIALSTLPKQTKADCTIRVGVARSFLFICALGITIFFAVQSSAENKAYKQWGNSRNVFQVKAYASANKMYEQIHNDLRYDVRFLFEYAQILANTEEYNNSNIVLRRAATISCDPMIYNRLGKNYQAMKHYNDAEKCFEMAENLVPHKLYPYYLLVKMYIEKGDTDKAIENANELLNMEVKISSPATKQMKSETQILVDSIQQVRIEHELSLQKTRIDQK